MVTMTTVDARPMPAPGDVVDVVWGLTTMRGRVRESYGQSSPHVIVELDAGEVSEEPATVSVPLEAVLPTPSTESPWAGAYRYERAVADAIRRLAFEAVEVEDDLLAVTGDGQRTHVEVKHNGGRKPTARWLSKRPGADIVVTDAELPASTRGAGIIVWRDPRDDDALREAIGSAARRAPADGA